MSFWSGLVWGHHELWVYKYGGIWAMGLRGMCGRGLRPLAAAKQLAKDWTCQQIELCC